MRNNLQHPVNCETGELNPPATAPDVQDECLVCGKHIPPGPDFCSDECEKRVMEFRAFRWPRGE